MTMFVLCGYVLGFLTLFSTIFHYIMVVRLIGRRKWNSMRKPMQKNMLNVHFSFLKIAAAENLTKIDL